MGDVFSVDSEFLDSAVVLVDDVYVVVAVDVNSGRAIKLSRRGAERPPLLKEFARRIEYADPVVMLVGDQQPLVAVQPHRHRPHELAVVRTIAVAELSQVVLVEIENAHPDRRSSRCVATVDYVYGSVGCDGEVVGIGESTSVVPIIDDANCLNVFQRHLCRILLCGHSLPQK